MIISIAAGCGAASPSAAEPSPSSSPEETPGTPENGLSGRGPTFAVSYADVYKALNDVMTQYRGGYGGMAMDGIYYGKSAVMEAAPMPTPMPSIEDGVTAGAPAAGPDYSQTNAQVQGVDEGDIVKTDGSYIYILRNGELIIFKADGKSTAKVSAIKVVEDNRDGPVYDMPAVSGTPRVGDEKTVVPPRYMSEYASDIYVSGNAVAVVCSGSGYVPYYAGDAKTDVAYGSKQISTIKVYDVTDRSAPALKAELGQDGYTLTTRLIGGTLYMISNYYVYDIKETDDNTFIPSLYENDNPRLVAPEAISIMPFFNSSSYTIVCAYDLADGTIGANQTVLGGGSIVYMNKDTLFIANSTTDQKAGEPYTESVYTVIDYTTTNVTDITSFDLGGGGIALKASGSVDGSLNSQFNMDEYGGNLRVVTTTYSQSWSEYTDKAKGFVNYIWKDPVSANGLTVLDSGLKLLGSVGDLAPGEQIYSARFDGDIGYFVTFRRVDPLFAVDLSDPAKPTVMSALKIPGFSEYLHVWSDGRLFGLGMNADPETGRTDSMKLCMFDTTDPADVSVKHELKLETSWSTALYNHKAILISPEKGLIAFPADSGYDIYTYSDETGFSRKATISSVQWSGDSRGLYIGNLAYIVDFGAVTVLDMTNFKLLNQIAY